MVSGTAASAAGRHACDHPAYPHVATPEETATSEPTARLPEYDPLALISRADRYALYENLRERPVAWSDAAHAWIVSRYDDVVAILVDTRRFTNVNAIGIAPFDTYPEPIRAVLATGYPRFPGIIEMDPPMHTTYRNLINTAFTPRRVAALEPMIAGIAHELVDRLADRTEGDFVPLYGDPLPVRVIGRILGVPVEDMPLVMALSDSFRTLEAGTIDRLPLQAQLEAAATFVEFQQYVAGMIRDRQAHPGDDLVSVVAAASLGGERRLTLEELVSTVIHLLFAGQETTTRLLASTMYLLLRDDRLWSEAVARPDGLAGAIEDALRMEPPVTYHLRKAKVPVTIGGAEIGAGDAVHLVFAAANRDPHVFADPDTFEPHRANATRHLGFGRGIHFCVGAPVGRLEARIGLGVLAARVPSIRLVAASEPAREDHVMLSGIASLPIRWAVGQPLPRS